MKANEFIGALVLAAGLAVMVGSVSAVMEYRERESLSRQLEEWQRREWINNLLEQRNQEFKQRLKQKAA